MNKTYFIRWETPSGSGAGFRTVSASCFMAAARYAESQIEAEAAEPAKPALQGDHLDSGRIHAWGNECTAVRIENSKRKAAVAIVRLEDFFQPSVVVD